jgi:hypothetical protein
MKLIIVLILSAVRCVVTANIANDGLVVRINHVAANHPYLEKRQYGDDTESSCQGSDDCESTGTILILNTTPSCDGISQCDDISATSNGGKTQLTTATTQTTATSQTTATEPTTETAKATSAGESPIQSGVTSGCSRPQSFSVLYCLIVIGSIVIAMYFYTLC